MRKISFWLSLYFSPMMLSIYVKSKGVLIFPKKVINNGRENIAIKSI